MRLTTLIRRFEFSEDWRHRVTLGVGARLNPEEHCVQLTPDAAGLYPTTANIRVATELATMSRLQAWLAFQAVIDHQYVDNVQVTGAGFRLSNGTTEYWWNSTAWVDASALPNNWNTEAEVANNIATFQKTLRRIVVITNLTTSDERYTPSLRTLKIAYNSDIDFQDDLIYRSLIPLLRAQVRPTADYPIEMVATSQTIDLSSDQYALDTPYNIVGIDAVFNDTDDPSHFVDLLASYNANTKVITLTGNLAAGKQAWIRFIYEPEVYVTTSQDYSEIDKVPAVCLEDIQLVNAVELSQDDTVINVDTNQGVKVKAPTQGDLEIVLSGITDKGRDQQRLADSLKAFFANNPLLPSTGLGENYSLWLIDEYAMTTNAGRKELHSGRLRFRIVGALFFLKPAEPVTGITRFLINDTRVVVT